MGVTPVMQQETQRSHPHDDVVAQPLELPSCCQRCQCCRRGQCPCGYGYVIMHAYIPSCTDVIHHRPLPQQFIHLINYSACV